MKAVYRGEKKEVWIISQTGERPDWVNYGFESNTIMWTRNSQKELRVIFSILMTANIVKSIIKKSQATRNFALSIGSGYSGAYETMFGKLGDVINLTDGIIVSAKNFEQTYKILQDDEDVLSIKQDIVGLTDRQSKYWHSLISLLEQENVNFYERRPLFLAYNSIVSGQNFGNVMRKLITDIENVQTTQKGELTPEIKELLIAIKTAYEV